MARRNDKKAWDQIETAGTQGDGTYYRLKGGVAKVFYHDKAALDGNELLAELKMAEESIHNQTDPEPAYTCGLFTEDVGGIRIAGMDGRSTFVSDDNLSELGRFIERRRTYAKQAELKIAERRIAELKSQLEREQAKMERLK
jgi:hypothetical protein